MRTSRQQNPLFRLVTVLAGAILVIFWAVLFWQNYREAKDWRKRLREAPSTQLPLLSDSPPSSDDRLRLAEIYVENVFPPNYQAAETLILPVLAERPLDSVTWLRLGRYKLFSGQKEDALIALKRSDQLDPNYPIQRMQTVRLWHFLGDTARSEDVAMQLANLGPEFTEDVVRELVLIGYSPRQVFELLDLNEKSVDVIANSIDELATTDPGGMEEILMDLPEEIYEKPEFRSKVAPITGFPHLPGPARRLWLANGAELISLEECGISKSIPAANLSLSNPAFNQSFYYGWQFPKELPWVSGAYLRGDENEYPPGEIRLNFARSSKRNNASYRWLFYRFPMPADSPVRLEIMINVSPPNRSACRFFAVIDRKKEILSGYTSPRQIGWQTLSLTLPPLEEPAVVELVLERRAAEVTEDQQAQVYLGPIKFDCARQETTP